MTNFNESSGAIAFIAAYFACANAVTYECPTTRSRMVCLVVRLVTVDPAVEASARDFQHRRLGLADTLISLRQEPFGHVMEWCTVALNEHRRTVACGNGTHAVEDIRLGAF